MTTYCEECKKECGVFKQDNSFTHEFGIKEQYAYVSDCCEADLYKFRCDTCDGTGEYYDACDPCCYITCPDCHGHGLQGEYDHETDGGEPEND